MPRRTGVLCGILGAACLASLHGADAAAACRPAVVHVGVVAARGCWSGTGAVRSARTPVTLNGLTLADGRVVADTAAGTIRSVGAVRWRLGKLQILRAPFSWTRGTTLTLSPTGKLHGLPFRGQATLAFTPPAGGTATLSALLTVPSPVAQLSGAVTLVASRLHGVRLDAVKVEVSQLPVERLVFKDVGFGYVAAKKRWHAQAGFALPTFGVTSPTVSGHVDVQNGRLAEVGADLTGASIPFGDGFVLDQLGLKVALDPLGVGTHVHGTFGPSLGGLAAAGIGGDGDYGAGSWSAKLDLTLPWLPAFTPEIAATFVLRPGTAVALEDGTIDLKVHHWGVGGTFSGFATGRAFNAEGKVTIDLPGPNLSGTALMSSKGAAACGKIFFGPRIGFGYRWGGALDFVSSSCDVAPWRVTQHLRSLGVRATLTPIPVSSVPFEVFAAQGGDFTVAGPGGSFSSVVDRNGPDAFVTHDPDDHWAYVVVPAPPDGLYTVAPVAGQALSTVQAADGLPEPELHGFVSAAAGGEALTWFAGGLVPGETVSFYQGPSSTQPGAAPILEDAGNGGGTQPFTPEPLGPDQRFVWAVVSMNGLPREVVPFADFFAPAPPPPGPTAATFLSAGAAGWALGWDTPNAATWQALVQASDGRSEWVTLKGAGGKTVIPAAAGVHVTVRMTPYDVYGRPGATAVCDSAAPGPCPSG